MSQPCDTEITLEDAFAGYGQALQEFVAVFSKVVDVQIEVRKAVAETVDMQKQVLLNNE